MTLDRLGSPEYLSILNRLRTLKINVTALKESLRESGYLVTPELLKQKINLADIILNSSRNIIEPARL